MKLKRLVQFVGGLVLLFVLWTLAVDKSWFVESCPNCGHSVDVVQVRFISIPLDTTRDVAPPSNIELIAADLGDHCTHPNLQRWHKHRLWGLWLCKCPCINGTIRLQSDDNQYDDSMRQKVKALGIANPALAAEFHQRVLLNDDRDYLFRFAETVRQTEGER